jgi:hypothetical protein
VTSVWVSLCVTVVLPLFSVSVSLSVFRVLEFNKFDLYTKDTSDSAKVTHADLDELWKHYDPILEKYGLGGSLMW